MTYNKQRLVIGVLFTLVVAYSSSGDAAPVVEPAQTVEQEIEAAPAPIPASPDYATFGKQIDMQISKCELEQQAVCVSVVIPFDLFTRAMKALQLVDSSI